MADIETGGGGHGKKKKPSTRVDFTPLVDLGFLLITFFMLTTSMTKPKTMEIVKPKKDDKIKDEDKNKLKASQAMTLILTKNNKIVYYLGLLNDPNKPVEPHVIGYGPNELRALLIKENKARNPKADSIDLYRQQAVKGIITEDAYHKNVLRIYNEMKDKALFVLIKTEDNSTYNNLVTAMDEMNITNIGSYAIVDIIPQEIQMADKLVP